MTYIQQDWQDGITPTDADHFNHMEQGIADAHAMADSASQSAADASQAASNADSKAQTANTNMTSHIGDYVRQPGFGDTAGVANAYTLALNPAPSAYVKGMGIVVKIHTANTGASTINVSALGSVGIVDSKGSALTAGKLRTGGVYALRHDGTNFQLQGEGGEYGTAGAEQTLEGYTLGTSNGVVNGTMHNNAGIQVMNPSSLYPQGLNFIIPKGYYDGIDDTIRTIDPNFTSGNIVKDKKLFGLTGTFDKIYGVGDTIPLANGENLNISIGQTIISDKTGTYVYYGNTSSGNATDYWSRLDPVTGKKLWTAQLKASDGYSANGFIPMYVADNGTVWGYSSQRSTVSYTIVSLSATGTFTKCATVNSAGGMPTINALGGLGRQQAMLNNTDFLVTMSNTDSHDGVNRYNGGYMSWYVNFGCGLVGVQTSTGYLLGVYNNSNGTYAIKKYTNAGAYVTQITTVNLGSNSNLSVYYDGSDEMWFVNGTTCYVVKVSDGTIARSTTSLLAAPALNYDATRFLVQAGGYDVYSLNKNDFTTQKFAEPSDVLTDRQQSLSDSVAIAAKDLMWVRNYGKLGISSCGFKITA